MSDSYQIIISAPKFSYETGPSRIIFSQYSRLSFSAVKRQKIWCFAFHLLVSNLHKTAADNMSLNEGENSR